MVVIARARMLAKSEADSIEPLTSEVTKRARAARVPNEDDPLCGWFTPSAAGHIRGIERSIRRLLIGSMTIAPNGTHLDRISGIAATFYVALFSVCRELASRFQSSNPTWLRRPKGEERRVRASRDAIVKRLTANLSSMAAALAAKGEPKGQLRSNHIEHVIKLADVTTAAIDSQSIDFILTSPPYCTRIDYTAATRIELAVLTPLLNVSTNDLARQMMGSIRVPDHEIVPHPGWGTTCNGFLSLLQGHSSKASGGYYYKTHLDYFEKMSRALSQLVGGLKDEGVAVLVVQDSYYKEIHNDLPKIVSEMATNAGLNMIRREQFRLRRSMSGINPHSRVYQRPSGATEVVLCFRKQ